MYDMSKYLFFFNLIFKNILLIIFLRLVLEIIKYNMLAPKAFKIISSISKEPILKVYWITSIIKLNNITNGIKNFAFLNLSFKSGRITAKGVNIKKLPAILYK